MIRPALNGTTDTPRVDALVSPFDRASREHPELVALARQLERELAEAKKPPPCQHPEVHGVFNSDGTGRQWCASCGADLPPYAQSYKIVR